MLHYPLNGFEIQKYYQNELKFNGVYYRKHISKIKDGGYVINLDDLDAYATIGTQRIAWYVNAENLVTLEWKIFGKFRKETKIFNKYLLNTSIQFNNVWLPLYWI